MKITIAIITTILLVELKKRITEVLMEDKITTIVTKQDKKTTAIMVVVVSLNKI